MGKTFWKQKGCQAVSGLMPFTAPLVHLMTKTPIAAASRQVGPDEAASTWQSFVSQLVKQNIVMISFGCLTFQPKENKLIQDPMQVL